MNKQSVESLNKQVTFQEKGFTKIYRYFHVCQEGCLGNNQTCKKYIFVRELIFGFKNVRTIHLEIFSKFMVVRVNIRVFWL